jgi:hypothetical protein
MKTYAHFLVNGVEQLGSDAWFVLDGRNSLDRQKEDAIEQMKRLKRVKPDYNGFQIRKGSIRNSNVIYTSPIIEVEANPSYDILKMGVTHPTIHMDYYKWLQSVKLDAFQRGFVEQHSKDWEAFHAIAMWVFSASREVLDAKARDKWPVKGNYILNIKYPEREVTVDKQLPNDKDAKAWGQLCIDICGKDEIGRLYIRAKLTNRKGDIIKIWE